MTWEPVTTRLAGRSQLFAPDLRGFGDSEKPQGPFGPLDRVADMLALLAALAVDRIGIVAHDVGGPAAMAREQPERFDRLFFFDFVYPSIGSCMAQPS